jgi:O-acetyl-ADP-ribose deacetylase (regulator of RNase III)
MEKIRVLASAKAYQFIWKGFKYVLQRDDLMKQPVNAIVNAANNDLWLGGGVAGAIRSTGGDVISKECRELIKSRGGKEVDNGEVVHTGIGEFKNPNLKYIFHAVGPIYRGGNKNEENELKDAFYNCFKLADELKISSIALPPISSGIFGYPKDECAEVFYTALMSYIEKINSSEQPTTLREVYMTIIDHLTYSEFTQIHDKVIGIFKEKFDGIQAERLEELPRLQQEKEMNEEIIKKEAIKKEEDLQNEETVKDNTNCKVEEKEDNINEIPQKDESIPISLSQQNLNELGELTLELENKGNENK